MTNLSPRDRLGKDDAVLVIDVQNDFCPGGALAVRDGDKVIPVLNEWIRAAQDRGLPVCLSRDWHPRRHLSFRSEGGPWPPHCIQDTEGAAFPVALAVPDDAILVTKGVRFDQDQYSAFDQTGLADFLRSKGVRRLWVGGLALDVCVVASVLDGVKAGFDVHVVCDGTRPITPDGGHQARDKMKAAGAILEGAA